MKKTTTLVLALVFLAPFSFGQHTEKNQGDAHEQEKAHGGTSHRITLVMGNSFLKNQIDASTNDILVAPTFGLNYDYLFHPRWGVGLHTDIVLQQFKVEKHSENVELTRANPVAVCAVGLFSPLPSLVLIAGYGIELEKHENIQLLRFGVEYGFHLPGNWELGFALEFDNKMNAYNSWIFGAGFSKLF